jgi:hypothetical protein
MNFQNILKIFQVSLFGRQKSPKVTRISDKKKPPKPNGIKALSLIVS